MPRSSFHTILVAADLSSRSTEDDAAQVFQRQDHCDACYATLSADVVFAHWKSVLPLPEEPPRKIVNLASLYTYFEDLSVRLDPGNAVPGSTTAEPEALDREEGVTEVSPGEMRVCYLLGLFLVRKRVLRWTGRESGDAGADLLVLARRGEPQDRIFRIPVPRIGERELEVATQEFNDLFD